MNHSTQIRVLIVEDDEEDFLITEKLISAIKGMNIIVERGNSFDAAFELIDKEDYDFYLIDYRLGAHSGLDLIQKIRHINSYKPIILLTGELDEELDTKALEVGATNYLAKSEISSASLQRTIRYALTHASAIHKLQEAHSTIEQRIVHQTLYDTLTDLPNRALFENHLNKVIATTKETEEKIGIMFLDLDRFKTINDTLGHARGDLLINGVTERLKALWPEETMVARFGADEFLIMVPDIYDQESLSKRVKKIFQLLKDPFTIEGRHIHINTSIGTALYPEDGETAEQLLKNADTALSRAKEVGGNTHRPYLRSMHMKANQHLALENDLRTAVERDEFEVHYQPIIDIKSGTVIRCEALIRWRHPELGLIYPGEFIHLAEESGSILAISEWILKHVCDQLQKWKSAQFTINVALNISARQFVQHDFTKKIEEILIEKQVDAHCLEVEITESIAMHNIAATIPKLSELKEMGISISIDDFGTGHSSLSYLKQLPIDLIKIDKSFITNYPEDNRDTAIVRAIVAMSKSLNIDICAEGIETPEQLGFLQELDCSTGQGYLFSKSLPEAEFIQWVQEFNKNGLPKNVPKTSVVPGNKS